MIRTVEHLGVNLNQCHGGVPIVRFASRRFVSSGKDKGFNSSTNETHTSKSRSGQGHSGESTATLLKKRSQGRKRSLIVPKVQNTDYISREELELEELFCGYRPLFLGNSPFIKPRYNPNNRSPSLPTLLVKLRLMDVLNMGSNSSSEKFDFNKIFQSQTEDDFMSDADKDRSPIFPWEVSVSGLNFQDEGFKNLPPKIVTSLNPFKPIARPKLESLPPANLYKSTKIRYHSPNINDRTDMVDLFDIHTLRNKRLETRGKYPIQSTSLQDKYYLEAKQKYEEEIRFLARRNTFIIEDQLKLKNDINNLSAFISERFHELTKLTINDDFKERPLPLFIYFQSTIVSRRAYKRFLRKTIETHIDPILFTVKSAFESHSKAKKFQTQVELNIRRMIDNLTRQTPHISFTDGQKAVDSVIVSSPVPSFKRIFWIKPNKRSRVFWGENIDRNYPVQFEGKYVTTRNGIKYMKYPINLNWRTLGEVFDEWNHRN
ncbi:hypothetical protein KAFR_0A08340 [Kazachstania africana CBS 2517]|uniref:Uncharacterized protein n=1 Tax=Kazachstania africana (strain ATCC 22294 / BCRC 22015 / CBS 2517 / CECT 1963 / NBRC 1671 / NRRL Y-8276) TaxID=1071382 RepID=H2APG8_KAZAF|nr:hypothetical protein KAFR_0A08340 [Kazachstania africana CBS 2517]CCF56268.1 hypothetical protein KAFR_0A08340 [Kazachstania africana CBS 2517]